MGFSALFSQHFDHGPPFAIPAGADDDGDMVVVNRSQLSEDLFGVLGGSAFSKLPGGEFFCAALRGEPPTVTFFLMIVEAERYFYFREQVRDVFNASASPEACFAALERMLGVFRKRSETAFKMVYSQGKLTVNGKSIGG